MPVFDTKHSQITGDGPVDISGLLTPLQPKPEPEPDIIPQPRQRSRTVMEELGLEPQQLQPLGQKEAVTPEGKAIQDRVSGRRNVRALEDIIGTGTEKQQQRKKERLGIADTIDLNSIPGIETGGTKKVAQAIKNHLDNLPSYAQRVSGLEESVLASASRASQMVDTFQELAKPTKEEKGKPTLLSRLQAIDAFLEETLPGLDVRTGRSIAAGTIGSLVSGFKGLEALTGVDVLDLVDIGGDGSGLENLRDMLQVENPRFADKLSSGFGSTLTFFIPGAGVAKGVSALSKGSKVLSFASRAGGVGVMSGLEALAESGEIYEQRLARGDSKEVAAAAANHGAALNMVLLGITNSFGFGGAQRTALKRILATAPSEAIQEALQTAISNYELGAEGADIWNGALESGIIGAIVGGVIGGATNGFNTESNLPTIEDKVDGRAPKIADQEYLQILEHRMQKDGIIGENRLTQLKPTDPLFSPERESREAGLSGPEESKRKISKQEARDIVEGIIEQDAEFQRQTRESRAETDETVNNALRKAAEAADVISNPKTRNIVQEVLNEGKTGKSRKTGFKAISELTPESFLGVIREARNRTENSEALDIFNNILKGGDVQITEDIDSDIFTEELSNIIDQRKSGRKARSERKRLSAAELAEFMESQPFDLSPTDLVENGVTVQDLIDTLVPPAKTTAPQRQEGVLPDFLQEQQDTIETEVASETPTGLETQAELGLGEKKAPFPNAQIPEESQFNEEFGFEITTPHEVFESEKPISQGLLDKLVDVVAQAKPAQIQLTGAQSLERSKRAARLARALQKDISSELGMTEEERAILSGVLVKESKQPQFEATKDQFSEAELLEMKQHINTRLELLNKPFDRMRARIALNKILELGQIPQASEIDLLETIFGPKFSMGLIRKMSRLSRINRAAKETVNASKNLMATFDDSFLLRQGLMEIIRHPSLAAPAIKDGFSAMASREYAHNHKIQLESHPLFSLAQQSGLEITTTEGTSVSALQREEEMGANIFAQLSLIRGKDKLSRTLALAPRGVGEGLTAFNRLATVTINNIRFQSFVYTANDMISHGMTPETHPNEFKRLAKMLNASTGRANIKMEGEIGEWMNAGFWSPRFTLSRIEAPLRTIYYAGGKGALANEARKRIAVAATYQLGLAYLLKLAADQWDIEAEVGLDPTKGNFLKLETKNHIYDISAGLGPVIRLFAREATAREGEFGKEPMKEASQFFRYRFSPLISAIGSSVWGTDPVGEETDFMRETRKLFAPLSVQETVNSMTQHGLVSILYVLPAEFFGIGTTTKDRRDKKKKFGSDKKSKARKFGDSKKSKVKKFGE